MTYPTPTVPTPCSFLASVYDRVHLLHLRLYCYISSTGCCKNQESCSKAYFFFLLELLYSFEYGGSRPPPPPPVKSQPGFLVALFLTSGRCRTQILQDINAAATLLLCRRLPSTQDYSRTTPLLGNREKWSRLGFLSKEGRFSTRTFGITASAFLTGVPRNLRLCIAYVGFCLHCAEYTLKALVGFFFVSRGPVLLYANSNLRQQADRQTDQWTDRYGRTWSKTNARLLPWMSSIGEFRKK